MVFRSSERQEKETRRAGLGFISYTGPCCVTNVSTQFLCFEECGNGPFFVGSLEFFLTKLFPSMVAAARERPLGNHVDQNLTKRFFNGACIFFPLVLCRHCSLHSRGRKARGKVENGRRNRREKETDSSPCPFRVPLKVKDF